MSLHHPTVAIVGATGAVGGELIACLEGRDPMTAPSNHSPRAAFDDRTLPDGAALYAELALRQLQLQP